MAVPVYHICGSSVQETVQGFPRKLLTLQCDALSQISLMAPHKQIEASPMAHCHLKHQLPVRMIDRCHSLTFWFLKRQDLQYLCSATVLKLSIWVV